MKEGFVKSADGLSIHYAASSGSDTGLLPLIFVPGMLGIVDFYKRELQAFEPRMTVAFSHRGLGKSELIPTEGLATFESRCTDIEAIATGLSLEEYAICGFSRGVAMTVAHALKYAAKVKKVILLDCDASYRKPAANWVEHFTKNRHPEMPLETIVRYGQEAESIDLGDKLGELLCPVLLIRGEKEGSLLTRAAADSMASRIRYVKQLYLPNSGHGVADKDFPLFHAEVENFLLH